MFVSHFFHDLHGELIMINGHICGVEDGSKLMLRRRHFVMFRLGRNAQFPELFVQIVHIGGDTGLQCAEIMILHLLAFGSGSPDEGAAAEDQVFSFFIQIFVHKKIFLFRSHRSGDVTDLFISKKMEYLHRLTVQRIHGAEKRRLFVQSLAAVGAESSGDIKSSVFNERRGSGIPGCVASGLEGGAQSAGGETGGVRFSFYQLFSGEIHDDLSVAGGRDKAVVLLRREIRHGLEPVGVMGGAVFNGPFFHGDRHGIGHVQLQMGSVLNGFFQGFVHVFGKLAPHDLIIEDKAAVDFRNIQCHNNYPPRFCSVIQCFPRK